MIRYAEVDNIGHLGGWAHRIFIFQQNEDGTDCLEIAECDDIAWCNFLFEAHAVTHVYDRERDEIYEPEFLTVAEELTGLAHFQKDLFGGLLS